MRYLLGLLVIAALAAGGVYLYAGRLPGPVIEIVKPEKFVGQSTMVEVTISSPEAQWVGDFQVTFEQNGKQTPLVSFSQPATAEIKQDGPGRVRITRTFGRDTIPDLKTGPAKIIVTAERPVLYGMRKTASTATRDVQVRLERPQIAVLSTKHYINLGGAEVVVYKATPADVRSGVRVGDLTYPGYPASGAKIPGINITDPAVKIAFIALRYDQDVNTPMYAYAQDEAGNAARADFDRLTFPKAFKKSRITLNERFVERVVPAILETTNEVNPQGSTIEKFVVINSELRRKNAEKIASYAAQSAPEMLWGGAPFVPFNNATVEAAFADQRTYVFAGKDVDRQTHLGFDLARVVNSPVLAGNRGKVVHAAPLGIYGNTVIIDHGMGLQSLYAHLSSIAVNVGDMVEKSHEIGRSGMTGMAEGDHLHFTQLVNGQMVNPVEWWDAHWIEDRILRKLREASGS
jgi:murein DD-endopeptidase MepM/ murein hydrolase activator NlpD